MQNESPIIQVEFTDKFKRNLRTLAKKYRSIRKDIQPIITQLEAGELLGDRLAQIDYTILKLRVKNSDIQKAVRPCVARKDLSASRRKGTRTKIR
nr:hypothetical protein [Pleurocapsa sp. FMAR1]